MSGPVISNASHPPPPPLSGSSISNSPMATNPPNAAVSAPGPPPPVQMQFRPVASVPPPGGQTFPPQFRPVPSVPPNLGMGPPSVTPVVPPLQGTPFNQQQRSFSGQIPVAPQSQPLNIPPPGIVRVNPPPTFTFVPNPNFNVIPQAPAAQPWTMTPGQTSSQIGLTGQQNSLTVNSVLGHSMAALSDWQEHIAPDGRRYYYNRRTRQSSWEKPFELMSPVERADASTIWKEFTAADGRKYYYNKATKQSTWTIPEEMKLAREQAQKSANSSTSATTDMTSVASPARASTISSIPDPVSITPANLATTALSKPCSPGSGNGTAGDEVSAAAVEAPPELTADASIAAKEDCKMPKKEEVRKPSEESSQEKTMATEEASTQDLQDAKKAMPSAGQINVTPLTEEKPLRNEEATVYANKNEARNAFRELLESVNVASDWTWEQAMRVIINDKRYGALKTLSERKQAFTEFLSHRKKQEAEEKRARQKKAREDFIIMLKESKELSSKMRWSKVVALFGDDPRFNAVEREREREELFDDYLVELEAKEKERAREERKKYLLEYRKFLESCDFIKSTTQWRKVADKLEDDERCYRLAKADRIDVFQEYVRDLEKAEEEEKKIQKEQQRRRERKNRDDFRKLMEEHRGSGILTARVSWRDYASMVKDNPIYLAVCSNTSGTTAKELFEDVAEDMEKQYIEDKARIREYIKSKKIDITPGWTFEKFRSTIAAEGSNLSGIAESNFRIVFDDLLERAKEKDEKEARRRKRAADDFSELLHMEKSISSTSTWEDCHTLLECTPQYRALDDENVCKKLFNDYVAHLQQKNQEKDKKREEEKERRERDREKDKDKDREKSRERDRKEKDRVKSSKKDKENLLDDADVGKTGGDKDDHKKEKHGEKSKHRDKKHKKHHRSKNSDDLALDKSEKEEPRKSRRHNGEKKKSSRKHGHELSSDAEHKHKKHRRDHEKGDGRSNDLEDGELGEDGEHS